MLLRLLPSLVFDALVEADFASSNSKLIKSYVVDYPANYKDEGVLDKLSFNSKGLIRVLPVKVACPPTTQTRINSVFFKRVIFTYKQKYAIFI